LLIRTQEIRVVEPAPEETKSSDESVTVASAGSAFVANTEQLLTRVIGLVEPGMNIHFYSFGNFNSVRLLLHILKQIGAAHVFMSSYSFSQRSIEQLKSKLDAGQILSLRLLIDNRVRVMSPKPFQMIMNCFQYRCMSVHAKVILIWNDAWKITIVTSQNATDNPKMERGTVFTDPEIFDFDYNVLNHEFDRGAL